MVMIRSQCMMVNCLVEMGTCLLMIVTVVVALATGLVVFVSFLFLVTVSGLAVATPSSI